MKALTPYLFFNGNCQEAMAFYQTCFDGNLELMTYGDSPKGSCSGTNADPNQIMHARLSKDDFILMASDNPMNAPIVGDNLSLSVNCETKEETNKLFQALSAGGKITMPLDNTFWGSYFGMLIDKYGFHWMVNCAS